MDSSAIPPPQSESPDSMPSSKDSFSWLRMIAIGFGILGIGFAIAIGGYVLGVKNATVSYNKNAQSPTIPTQPSEPLPTFSTSASNCTSDNECPNGYACEALQEEGTACPVSSKTINPDGTVTNNAVISCTPTYKIIKGQCKLKKDGICTTDNDCSRTLGLICHAVLQGQTTIHKCEESNLGSCSGPSDTSCPAGYQCVKGCGPPIIRLGDNTTIPWYCTANEIAGKPRACPICLASNTMIATPHGEVNVKNIKVGMDVWSINKKGEKILSRVIKTGSTIIPDSHKVIHLVLRNGKEVWVSPNHPTVGGRAVGTLHPGEYYINAKILQVDLISYWDSKTYDILPDSDTGFYFANGILLGSTLK